MMPQNTATLFVLSLVLLAGCADGKARIPSPSAVSTAQPMTQPPPASKAAALKAEARVKPSALKVATFNINFGNVDLQAIADTIANSGADFVFLQETNRQSANFLKEELRNRYEHSQFIHSNRRWAAGGFGFLSKRPFDAPRYLHATQGLFGTFVTKIDIDGTTVNLVNLHLSPIRIGQASGFGEVLAAVAAMEEVHEREAKDISELFDSKTPTIIAGDFNSTSNQRVPKQLLALGFVDAIGVTMDNADLHRTWRWPIRGREVGFRIDYVFHSPHFVPISGEIIHSEASDHHLVLSDLAWTNP